MFCFIQYLMAPDPFRSLAAMAHLQGLIVLEYSDDRGASWMEIRPPMTGTAQVPFYGYHSMCLIVNCQLDYWLKSLGQCVRWTSFRSPPITGSLDVDEAKAVLHLLAGGATLCYDYNCTQ